MSDWKNLQYKDGKMRTNSGSGGASALSDLTDVDLTNISDGQILKWDATNGKWVNGNESGGGGIILPECTIRRSEYSGVRYITELMNYIGIASGSAAFSMEAYFTAYENYDGYIVSWGGQSTHQAFGMSLNHVVTWGDDWDLSGTHTGTHHRVITYDGNKTVKTYEDNVLISTKTLSSALNFANSYVYWGKWIQTSPNDWAFRGNIYYCKYYNRTLTAEEVAVLYNNRKKSSLIV